MFEMWSVLKDPFIWFAISGTNPKLMFFSSLLLYSKFLFQDIIITSIIIIFMFPVWCFSLTNSLPVVQLSVVSSVWSNRLEFPAH